MRAQPKHSSASATHAGHIAGPLRGTHMQRYGSVEPTPERSFPAQEQEDMPEDTPVTEPEEKTEAEEHIVLPHYHEEGKCGEPENGNDDEIRSTALF